MQPVHRRHLSEGMHVVHTIPLGCFSTCLRHPDAQKELQHCVIAGAAGAAEDEAAAIAAAAAAIAAAAAAIAAAAAAAISAAAASTSRGPCVGDMLR